MDQIARFEISQIIQRFLPEVESKGCLSGYQRSILKLISQCKTATLGGHKERCNHCHYTRIHYNSCGNRHCPSCKAVNKHKWLHDRKHDRLPVKYFHGVFTVPSELYKYFRYNKKRLYNLLFRSVRETLLAFGYDPKQGIGGKIGAICILHTWTQLMTYHPHVHCIIPAGGLTKNGHWKHAKSNGSFLFPVRALSRLFRGKLLAGIHEEFQSGHLNMSTDMLQSYRIVKDKLYKKEWVVYAKETFRGPQQVFEYLARYTHKICISNYRILKVDNKNVTFRYLDRKMDQSKIKTVQGSEFIKRFAEHILPKGFVRIRHIGLLSSRVKKMDLHSARKSLKATQPPQKIKVDTREFILMTKGKDIRRCPRCSKGEMIIIDVILPTIRGSPGSKSFRRIPKYRKIKMYTDTSAS